MLNFTHGGETVTITDYEGLLAYAKGLPGNSGLPEELLTRRHSMHYYNDVHYPFIELDHPDSTAARVKLLRAHFCPEQEQKLIDAQYLKHDRDHRKTTKMNSQRRRRST